MRAQRLKVALSSGVEAFKTAVLGGRITLAETV